MFKNQFGEDVNPDEAIVAIIAFHQDIKEFEILGTGFYIHGQGVLVTAKHVIVDFNGKLLPELYIIETNKKLERKLRIVDASYLSDTHDIAVLCAGHLKDPQTGQESTPEIVISFQLSSESPKENELIKTYAFPSGKQNIKENETILTFKGQWSTGEFVENKPFTARLTYNCYEIKMSTSSGASGGPVLLKDLVIGLNSVSYDPYEGEPGITYATPIEVIRSIELPDWIVKMVFG